MLRAPRIALVIFLVGLLSPVVRAENSYPIILVHGFMGWGRDEMGGYNYWGGLYDIEEYLREQGYQVYTASVGPVSSNWDRAVELYYQIKGGQVDYGKRHADRFGLIQKPPGKRYSGLFPAWDAEHPVHIIGHSMGGQTARMLLYLLTESIYSDAGGTQPEESALLGQSRRGWIRSITTISTPHNGTTLSDLVSSGIPFLQDFIALAAVVGNDFFDFDLQQWDFERRIGERWIEYVRRLREHPAWETQNISAWDLSLEGARQLNTLLMANPGVYYFSFATSGTVPDSASGRHVPGKQIRIITRSNARVMGRKPAYWADGTATDSTWFENDGIVNTVSMIAPTTGLQGPDPVTDYQPGVELLPGRWYFMGTLRMDHKGPLGHGIIKSAEAATLLDFFHRHVRLLTTLP